MIAVQQYERRLPIHPRVEPQDAPAGPAADRFYEANPSGDHWTFQWIDTALLGGLTVALLLGTVLVLRRRA
ncbi:MULTISPECIES: hypothetical protein [unclassified Streptomyces]|uniref:hypothetical protein n=1 Tax=unclassified Streptomyces TaxID=2593676 RepID=UPI001F518ECA|nr:hypothetical protein [Streptomyces sp. TSRI0107]